MKIDFNKLYAVPLVCLLALNANASSDEYIPPPTGPYQSSVIINTMEQDSIQQQPQVYKFPSADLIEESVVKPQLYSPNNKTPAYNFAPEQKSPARVESTASVPQAKPIKRMPVPLNNQQVPESIPAPSVNYSTGEIKQPVNPWAFAPNDFAKLQPMPNYQGQGAWESQRNQAGYQYPYGNPNQYYNMMKQPYNNMPSPWSMMPVNPFSQGR